MKELAILLWDLIGALKGLLGSGVLLGALVLSLRHILSLPSEEDYRPSRDASRVSKFNRKRNSLKQTCWTGIVVALVGLLTFVFARYSIVSDEAGSVTSMSWIAAIAVYATAFSALASFLIQLYIWKRHSELPDL